jgi:hypothetical protein
VLFSGYSEHGKTRFLRPYGPFACGSDVPSRGPLRRFGCCRRLWRSFLHLVSLHGGWVVDGVCRRPRVGAEGVEGLSWARRSDERREKTLFHVLTLRRVVMPWSSLSQLEIFIKYFQEQILKNLKAYLN